MSAFARERIKQAHNGRETRGVLAETMPTAVGSSTRSIVSLFLNCALLFFTPLMSCLLAFALLSYYSSLPWQHIVVLTRHTFYDYPSLVASIYFYWSIFCVYFVHLTRPHALNVVKHQTFKIPWRFRRDHVSHMRLDRLRRVSRAMLRQPTPRLHSLNTSIQAVDPTTTVMDIREAVCHHSYNQCHTQGPIYLMGRWRPLRAHENMSDLGVFGLRHFIMPPRLLGGAPGNLSVRKDGIVVNDHGWEQCGTNPDGTLKAAEDIDFGSDPGTPPAEASASGSRPRREQSARFKAAVAADGEELEDDKPKGRKRGRRKPAGNGKQKETLSDPEDFMYLGEAEGDEESDSDASAEITNEELAESLPTKTVPAGTSRHTKDNSTVPKRQRKKQKTGPQTNPEIGVDLAGPSNSAEPDTEEEVNKGDNFYRCRHGSAKSKKKVLKITTAMRGSLNGLSQHLKSNAPHMYRLYEIMHSKERTTPITSEEIDVAEGRTTFAVREELVTWLDKLAGASGRYQQSLRESFNRASEKSAGPWNQAEFERLLVEWLIACDQPFQEVERPEFRRLMQYVYHRAEELSIRLRVLCNAVLKMSGRNSRRN
ncbi:hypothetical protein B0H14DRAFT_2633974 [Mycena olivaceomarginata]|nr:hypothetical protein B0H14DRAFT_2633974 [Mycena olivaceomarginata]